MKPATIITIIACCVGLSGCYTGYSLSTRPKTYPKTSTVPRRDATYKQRDKTGCRTYVLRTGERVYWERWR